MSTEIEKFWEGDALGRKESAQFLYNYIIKNPHVRVLNVNSPWGTGKTFFLDRWKEQLKQDHICVSFNAWKNDFSPEPLISLVSAISEQLKDDSTNEILKEKIGNLISKTASAIKSSSPVIAKGLLLKFAGINSDEISEAVKQDIETISEASEKALESLLENQRAAEKTIDEFQSALSDAFQQKKSAQPYLQDDVFIIIDELDRCRPTYAIELLERIKHFFVMDNCRFIIASDTEQLAHSIRAVYGEGFDSSRYLKRFFDADFSLDNTNLCDFINIQLESFPETIREFPAFRSIGERIEAGRHVYADRHFPEMDQHTILYEKEYRLEVLYVTALSRIFNTSLREIEKNIKQLRAIYDNSPAGFQFLYVAFLIFLKDAHPGPYKVLFNGSPSANCLNLIAKEITAQANILFAEGKLSPVDIFQKYYNCSTTTKESLRKDIGATSGVFGTIINNVFNHYARIKQYPKIIDLASALH